MPASGVMLPEAGLGEQRFVLHSLYGAGLSIEYTSVVNAYLNTEIEDDRFFTCVVIRQGKQTFSIYMTEQITFQPSW